MYRAAIRNEMRSYMKALPIIVALVLFVLTGAAASVAYADRPASPRDFTKVSENRQYIFVMLARDEISAYNQTGFVLKDVAIRSKYKQSGLYRNDESTTPLWTVDWYSFGVEVSSDGHHLIKYGPWPPTMDYAELALAFYEDGREIQSYNVYQLVMIPFLLPASVSHYQWLEDASFDDAQGRLSIVTKTFEHYAFDVSTGNMVEGFQLPFLPKCLAIPLATAAVWFGFRFLIRKSRQPQASPSA